MRCYAIDLGTTNTILARAEIGADGKITACACPIDDNIPMGLYYTTKREHLLPSAVFYDVSRREVVVGTYAVQNYNQFSSLISKSVKSQVGNSKVKGLSDDVPDKTPEQVQARILKQIVISAKKSIGRDIREEPIVITVPAKFNSIKREATKKAAQLAGFKNKVTLISEVGAVVYHVANQIMNNEIPSDILDLRSSQKKVLVFDMGGGTLDVECLEITPRNDGKSLEIVHLAPSRLDFAGDEFDATIADILFERCLKKFEDRPVQYKSLKDSEVHIKNLLRTEAEKLKIDMSNSLSNDEDDGDSWFGEEEEHIYSLSTVLINDIKYYDEITITEFKEMVEPLFARQLRFEDYMTYTPNPKDRHIIAPVMEALKEATADYRRRGIQDIFRPDAVILAGGMTKFPLIKQRLQEFFDGIANVLSIADPDLSVACGAATYATIMQNSGNTEISDEEEVPVPPMIVTEYKQNHDLFLGLAMGANEQLIKRGEVLPFDAKVQRLRLKPGTKIISIPIKIRKIDGSTPIIARTSIQFSKASSKNDLLDLKVCFDKDSMISIQAELQDESGALLSSGEVKLTLGDEADKDMDAGEKIIPYVGATLNPGNEISTLKQLYQPGKKKGNKQISAAQRIETICSCGNKRDFHPFLMKYLSEDGTCAFKTALYQICDAMLNDWTPAEQARFREIARRDLIPAYAISVNASRKQLSDTVQAILDRFV
ncbi:MAG: Hsp70 family protein [Clostridia bacterium]|nr:Hsp70 family protein [Clostridia bacterium]